MRIKFLIIPTILLAHAAIAQNGGAAISAPQGTASAPPPAATSTAVVPPEPEQSSSSPALPASTLTAIMDYKSVYETASIEEEVKMASDRFQLTSSQQEMWMVAAADRRQAEKQVREKLDSKTQNYEKDGIYRGLRTAQNTFHETIIGYLTPTQKQALETDRLILQEKQKRLAKLPPPPPPAPTVTVAPVDSAAIKAAEKDKQKGKKSKKKKKPAAQ
jgi:hypothetical protein